MMSQGVSIALLFCTVVLAVASPSSVREIQPRVTCATGFHIIVARATDELPGEGSTASLAKSIVAKVPGSDSVALSYPALPAPFYNNSVHDGVGNLQSDIKAYISSCPKANIVLLGYDQGADVVGDVLGGSGARATDAIEGMYAEAIKGIILLSDPSYVPGQPYDAGTSRKSGEYPRSRASLRKMLRFSDIMKSYCDKGDTVCAGGSDIEANRQYLTKYQAAATAFIVGLYK